MNHQDPYPNTMMSHYSNPPSNPNPYSQFPTFTHPQPLPGYDPYSNSGFDPLHYSSIPGQPINYSDPNLQASNWVVKQSAPIKYSSAIQVQPAVNEAITSTSYVPQPSYNFVGQRLVNRVPKKKQFPKKKPKKPSVNQSVRCELCKIDCNTVQVYEKHLSGRKHSKAVLNLCAPAIKAATQEKAVSGGEGGPSASSKTVDLEVKKQNLLKGGTSVQALRICTICNVACNGEVAFSDHVAGRKHISKERALNPNANPIPSTTQETNTQSKKKRKNGEPSSSHAWCEVCKISCTSNDGLQVHILGRKHQKNLQNLQKGNETTTTDPTKPPGPPPPPKKKKKVQSNDVDSKKQKVLENGTASSSMKTCTICNVVCNSETVFQSHLAGQKHASMVKQAEARKVVGPPIVCPSAV